MESKQNRGCHPVPSRTDTFLITIIWTPICLFAKSSLPSLRARVIHRAHFRSDIWHHILTREVLTRHFLYISLNYETNLYLYFYYFQEYIVWNWIRCKIHYFFNFSKTSTNKIYWKSMLKNISLPFFYLVMARVSSHFFLGKRGYFRFEFWNSVFTIVWYQLAHRDPMVCNYSNCDFNQSSIWHGSRFTNRIEFATYK